jgi:hypothetical protein
VFWQWFLRRVRKQRWWRPASARGFSSMLAQELMFCFWLEQTLHPSQAKKHRQETHSIDSEASLKGEWGVWWGIVPSHVTKQLCWANFEFGLEVLRGGVNASISNITYNAWRSILYLPFFA